MGPSAKKKKSYSYWTMCSKVIWSLIIIPLQWDCEQKRNIKFDNYSYSIENVYKKRNINF